MLTNFILLKNFTDTSQVRSGNIFYFETSSSGIARWTDGHTWSSSRPLANQVFVYRGEVADRKEEAEAAAAAVVAAGGEAVGPITASRPGPEGDELAALRPYVGALVSRALFRSGELIKKAIAFDLGSGIKWNVIAYYSLDEVLGGNLGRVRAVMPAIGALELDPSLSGHRNWERGHAVDPDNGLSSSAAWSSWSDFAAATRGPPLGPPRPGGPSLPVCRPAETAGRRDMGPRTG